MAEGEGKGGAKMFFQGYEGGNYTVLVPRSVSMEEVRRHHARDSNTMPLPACSLARALASSCRCAAQERQWRLALARRSGLLMRCLRTRKREQLVARGLHM